MAEKLIPIELPPGFQNNGTTYQSKNRWHLGTLVRFALGRIMPVGGWTQRTLTGASITGTPNAMHSWEDNSGNKWVAVGTTTGLFVIDASNVVTNITPTQGAIVSTAYLPSGTYQWSLTNFGAYLVAVLRTTQALPINPVFVGDPQAENVYVWNGLGVATQAYGQAAGPTSIFGVCATPERFVLLLGGGDPAGYARPATWTG